MSVHDDLNNEWTDAQATIAAQAETVAELEQDVADLTRQLADCHAQIPPAPTNPSGQPPPYGDLAGWRQIFIDDFGLDVPLGQFPGAVNAMWGAYPTTYKDTSKNGTYDPARTISIQGSVMRIHMHTDTGGVVRVAAPVPYIRPPTPTAKWPGQLYGRYAIRARFVNLAPGYKVAWLLWPDSGSNTQHFENGVLVPGGNGEIDFPEHNLAQRSRTSGFMHYQGATVGSDQYGWSVAVDTSQWHTYITEWSKDLCRFSVDDGATGVVAVRVPNTSMHYVIQCETEIGSGAIKPAAGTVADIEVDWLAIWAKAA